MNRISCLVALFIFSAGVRAQEMNGAPVPPPPPPVPVHQLEKQNDEKLNLTKEQKEKIKEIRENRRNLSKKRHEENKEFHKNLNKKTEEEIKAILTPEQNVQFEKMKAERKAQSEEMRQKRFENRKRGGPRGRFGQRPAMVDSTMRN